MTFSSEQKLRLVYVVLGCFVTLTVVGLAMRNDGFLGGLACLAVLVMILFVPWLVDD